MRICFIASAFEKLGVEYVSAALKLAGHEVLLAYDPRLFNDSFWIHPSLARRFDLEPLVIEQAAGANADLYALSILSADWNWALRMARGIKRRTGKPVVVGGVHPTAAPEVVLDHPEIDYVVTGEGEAAALDLIEALENGREPLGIPNVGFRRNGETRIEPNRPLVEDLDRLPFPDKEIYYSLSSHFGHGYNTMASRGCQKSCSYCFQSWYRGRFPDAKARVAHRSVGNLIEELERAKRLYDFRHIRFEDDDFCSNRTWLAEFAEEYPRRLGVPYRIFTDPDSIDEGVARALERSNCFEVDMGIQAVAEDVRTRLFGRPQTPDQCLRAIQCLKKTKITCVTDIIFGYPGQTREETRQTLSFFDEARPDRVLVMWLRYWPGSTILQIAQERGYLSDRDVRAITEHPSERSCIVGESKKEGWQTRAACFLYAAICMPRWFNRFWMANDRYRWMPRLPGLLLFTLVSLLVTKHNMYVARISRRYLMYGLYRFSWLRGPVRRRLFGGGNPLLGGRGSPG